MSAIKIYTCTICGLSHEVGTGCPKPEAERSLAPAPGSESETVNACLVRLAQNDEEIMRLRECLQRCLDALDQEALAADKWQRPASKCPAWYMIRSELRDRLTT